jgi:hypothetical protein
LTHDWPILGGLITLAQEHVAGASCQPPLMGQAGWPALRFDPQGNIATGLDACQMDSLRTPRVD